MDYLDSLNEPQRQAVTYSDGPSLVIAGAGSGKTRVLTYKIAYLLQSGLKPQSILALTFTKKAATEMKDRIAKVVGNEAASKLWMGTFHSIFARILRAEAEKLGLDKDFTIYDGTDSQNLLATIIKERKLDDKTYNPKKMHAKISRLKNDLITPQMYKEIPDFHERDVEDHLYAFGDLYAAYAARCKNANALDFDDILLFTNILLRDDPQVAFKYQNKFRFILVDEYQDTNASQYRIIRKLCQQHHRLCVVGDDAQSIYGFRGADVRNILSFTNDYPEAKVVRLEQNYRSTQTIVNVANSLISKNTQQLEKHAFSEQEVGNKVRVFGAYSEAEESMVVANSIDRLVKEADCKFSDFAVLYRVNTQSRLIEKALREKGIPSRVWGGKTFYQRADIKNIVSYCRLAVNHHDEEAFKRIVNDPPRGIGDVTVGKIFEQSAAANVSFWDVVDNIRDYDFLNEGTKNKVAAFAEMINDFGKQAAETDAYAVVDSVIKRSGIWADAYKDNELENKNRQQNLAEMLRSVFDFKTRVAEEDGADADLSLNHFLTDIALLTSVDEGDDNNKVTLMTVHASKGLEFKEVFIIGVEEGMFPSKRSASDESVEEERRLMYVAITRAEKNCYITYCKSRMEGQQSKVANPSRFIKEIDPNLLILPKEWKDTASVSSQRGEARWSSGQQFNLRRPTATSRQTSQAQPASQPSTGVHPLATGRFKPASTLAGRVGPVNISQFQVGTFVKHKDYGIGQIKQLEGSGKDTKAFIEFNHFGIKKIFLAYAAANMQVINA